ELATKTLHRTEFERAMEDLTQDVFDIYVARRNRLIALSTSLLSNHIGGTTLIITSDNILVLQRQGSVQIDAGRWMVGASGSSDWSDIAASPKVLDRDGRPRATLQNVARAA